MADKPRVKAPKQRDNVDERPPRRRRTWAIAAVDRRRRARLRRRRRAARCRRWRWRGERRLCANLRGRGLHVAGRRGARGRALDHEPGGTSNKWNTDPADERAALRHRRHLRGGLRGRALSSRGSSTTSSTAASSSSTATTSRTRPSTSCGAFYDDHKTGTIMAPLDRLGDEFALGAWVVDGDTDNGFLAKCTTFDEDARLDVLPLVPVPRARALRPGDLPPGH